MIKEGFANGWSNKMLKKAKVKPSKDNTVLCQPLSYMAILNT